MFGLEQDEIDYSAGYSPKIPVFTEREERLPRRLWTEILPNLWLGGTAGNDIVPEVGRKVFSTSVKPITKKDFDTVVTLYAWANPCDWLVKEIRYGYYDSPKMDTIDLDSITQLVEIAYADWKAGKKVLVRCQAGLNRSSLIMALVLMKEGYDSNEAISLMRDKRSPLCLFNKVFEAYIRGLDS